MCNAQSGSYAMVEHTNPTGALWVGFYIQLPRIVRVAGPIDQRVIATNKYPLASVCLFFKLVYLAIWFSRIIQASRRLGGSASFVLIHQPWIIDYPTTMETWPGLSHCDYYTRAKNNHLFSDTLRLVSIMLSFRCTIRNGLTKMGETSPEQITSRLASLETSRRPAPQLNLSSWLLQVQSCFPVAS